MLWSLTANTSPTDLRLVLVDLKNEDLVPFASLPHTDILAASLPDAEEAIARLHDIKERRVRHRSRGERIVLVIDELAELARLKDPMRQLASILAIGRSKSINVLAATQKPLGAIVGSVAKANFTTRLVGRVMSGDDARVAAGVSGIGAEFLPGRGSFLRVEGHGRPALPVLLDTGHRRAHGRRHRPLDDPLPIRQEWVVAEEQGNAHL